MLESGRLYTENSTVLERLGSSRTNVDKASNLEYNVDACDCMGCGCFESAWTIVLSPAGVAAGMAAYAADAAL
jgi:hypothetical protein